jgi:hypothetical protein
LNTFGGWQNEQIQNFYPRSWLEDDDGVICCGSILQIIPW